MRTDARLLNVGPVIDISKVTFDARGLRGKIFHSCCLMQ